MILGLSIPAFTALHVVISLIAVVTGVIVVFGMLGAHRLSGLTALFLGATVATSATGFLFPIHGFTPALGTGAVSLVVLAVALVALYGKRLAGGWRRIYVVTAVTALYFNVLVLIVQAFQKVPALHPLAPTGAERPFLIVQSVALIVFVATGIAAVVRFKPGRLAA